jgi:hypothetical protein
MTDNPTTEYLLRNNSFMKGTTDQFPFVTKNIG